ncbi:molybdopterin-dependent oxidoreductase, partial [Kitasatospora nipponensis]|uniref:molybdopterin-dependent oxidoreductase n=1 Tax=Kitasatospora nipponensis TaxID=258049 RepID=UPI0031E00101
ALGAGELVTASTGPASAAVVTVDSSAVDLTPTPLKEYAVSHFGTDDKQVLMLGTYLVLAAFAALAGLLAVRRPPVGAALFGLFGGLGIWAALTRPTATWPDVLPPVVAALVVAVAVVALARRYRAALAPARVEPDSTQALEPTEPEPTQALEPTGPERTQALESAAPEPTAPGFTPARRSVLIATGGTVAFAALAGFGGRASSARRYDVTAARRAVRLPPPARPAAAIPASAHPPVPGLSSFVTPSTGLYRVDTALTLPQIHPDSWSLRIHGLVDHPVLITFDDLLRLPLQELDHTLSCVSNEVGGPYVGTVRWLGASLPDLLRRAGVRAGADQLVGRSQDGMTIGTPLASVLDGRTALLAVAMNGEPLPVAHGFPCRSVVPGCYGYTSATKWLVDLEVTTFARYDPYWVRRGWDRTGTVRTASRIEVPAGFARVPAGDVTVAGTAWATHRGITAVEVRVDGGPWAEARLAADAGTDLWRQWSYDWTGAKPGTRRIEVRATDAGGAVQTEDRATPFPSGSTGWHSTVVIVT